MSTELVTTMTISGNKDELKAVLEVLAQYGNETQIDDIYFDEISVNDVDVNDLFDEEEETNLLAEIENGLEELSVWGFGPFGGYCGSKDLRCFFLRLANAVPHATFKGAIKGSIDNYGAIVFAELSDGTLCLRWGDACNRPESDEDWDDQDSYEDWDDQDSYEEALAFCSAKYYPETRTYREYNG